MLEQAIVDAAALREAALKNAEQSVIEKYAPEIKAAVNSLLESDNVITEQEMGMESTPAAAVEAPFAVADQSPGQEVEMGIEFTFDAKDFLDLGDLKQASSPRRRPTGC
jgi:DNA replication initiation complex subunit (GINS family)